METHDKLTSSLDALTFLGLNAALGIKHGIVIKDHKGLNKIGL